MVMFTSQYTQHYYTKFVALHSVIQQSTHKTTTQNVIQNINQRSRIHVHKREYMIPYRLWRMFIEVIYVTVIKLNDNIKGSWSITLKYHYFSTKSLSTVTHLSHLDTVLVSIAQEGPTFYLVNSISAELQVLTCTATSTTKNLSTVRIACDINEAVNCLDKDNC